MRLDKEEILDKDLIKQIQIRTQARILELEKEKKEKNEILSNQQPYIGYQTINSSKKL